MPYAKKIKLHSKRGTLFEKLYRVIEFEKKKNECLKELYEDKTSGDTLKKKKKCLKELLKTKPVEILEIFTFYFTQSSYNLKFS